MRVRRWVKRGAAVMSVAALATAGLVLSVGASAGAASTEKSFEEEGEHDYVVPEGVCWVWIEADGASGGDAIDDSGFTSPGGEGGHAKARVPVTPGELLYVFVGGEGEDAVDQLSGEGGYNGGGDGGIGDPNEDGDGGAGGGGGSDVRQGGIDLSDRIVVAGGGGGAGGGNPDPLEVEGDNGDTAITSAGGDGGGEEGDDGQPSFGALETQAGEGGNEDEGGDGGVVDPGASGRNGDDGEAGEGGDGGGFDPAFFQADGGGGGGGGLYGGGGGAASRSDTAEEFPDGAGGGGGSGWVPEGGELETGEHDGEGEVTISYDPVTDGCAAEAIEIEPKFTG